MEATKPAGTPDASAASELPRPGDVLAGKYRIDRVLGQGGMGVVVAAHHTTLRQNVAVKFLLSDAARRAEGTERFLREARAAVSIQSEHVARVSDVGTLDNGAPYMVMELLSGADLGDVLKQRGALPIDEAVDYVLQACEAIAEAHSLGLVHRDLKPANLFLTKRADGSSLVKVLDFGLSKAAKADTMDASLTASNVVMGSPYYMSPEQIRSFKAMDARSDVWSLGVILYELIAGVRPFEGESLGGLLMAIGADPVPPIRDVRREVPEALEAAILGCLEKDPKKRTQTVAALAKALAPFGVETSRISVERILRVLADPDASLPGKERPSRTGPTPPVAPVQDAARGEAVSGVAEKAEKSDAAVPATTVPELTSSAKRVAPTLVASDATPVPGVSAGKAERSSVPFASMAALSVSGPTLTEPAAEPARRGPGRALVAGLVVGVLALAGGGLFLQIRGGDPAHSPSAGGTPAAISSSSSGGKGAVSRDAPANGTPSSPSPPEVTPADPASAAPSLFGRLPGKPGASGTAQAGTAAPTASAAPTAATAASSAAATAAPTAAPGPTPSATAGPTASATAGPTAPAATTAAPTAPAATTAAPPSPPATPDDDSPY